MTTLTSIFDSIEKLAYDILIWILLVPKTLVKILLEPGWVPGYVSGELGEKEGDRFDDYLSPVILILIASLLPYLYQLVTPYPGASIESAVKVEEDYGEVEVGGIADFWVYPDFIADTGEYEFEWIAEGGEVYYSEGDSFGAYWDESGYHEVTVTVWNDKDEELWDWFGVYVLPEGVNPLSPFEGGERQGANRSDVLSALQGTEMVLPALIFLGLPMLFAIATDAFRGFPLMRSTLRRSFYIQCYYFSPVILVMWSLYLGDSYFIAPTDEFVWLTVFAVSAFMLLWLVWNETKVIHSEREMKSRWMAFGIVLVCLAVFMGTAILTLLFVDDSEIFRQFLGWAYVLATVGILISWFRARRKRKAEEKSV